MNYLMFKNKYSHLPVLTPHDIANDFKNVQILRNQLNRWQKSGLIQKLKRGIFIFNQADRKKNINMYYIANRLYEPSYISLESALNYYGFIPERVVDVTSVSTQKTMQFNNDLGCFLYKRIKPSAFRGFKQIKLDEQIVFMAEPEKAILDFFYFNLSQLNKDVKAMVLESFRFQNFEEVSIKRLRDLCVTFQCKKLTNVIKQFCSLIEEHSER